MSDYLITSIRRYEWKAFCQWLSKDLKFEVVDQADYVPNGTLGDGMILLRKS